MARNFFLVTFFAVLVVAQTGTSTEPTDLKFNRDIRPILSSACFQCHGPDDKKRSADLRLDTRDGATRDLGGYAAIVPGEPDKSVLLERVSTHDADELMPPPASKKPRLSAEQAAALRRWIASGAEYEDHWSFLPLADLAPPAVRNEHWVRTPIDRFIVARLEQAGIEPAPEADRATLLRRLAIDLTGLLPSPEEVRAFVDDGSIDAYERQVDRLLASPHYGERWGRHWLDQARYADTNGYSIDAERAQWPYRDWVIKALNDDLPFDQFTIEQLAGDLLDKPTKAQLVATGFHRNTLINQEGGTDKEQFRNEVVVDRVNTTGAVWLGLTIGCAQCHSHKFDPLAHDEYYRLFAFYNHGTDVNDRGATVTIARGEIFGQPVPTNAAPSAAELARRLQTWEAAELKRVAKQEQLAAKTVWTPARYVDFSSATNSGLRQLDDNSIESDGRGAYDDTYTVVVETELPKIAAIRLRVFARTQATEDDRGGNFLLTDFDVRHNGQEVAIASAFADVEETKNPIRAAFDEKPQTGWSATLGDRAHEAVFTFKEPLSPAGKPIQVQLRHDGKQNQLIGRFDLALTSTAPPTPVVAVALVEALRIPLADRNEAQQRLVRAGFDKELAAETAARNKLAETATHDVANVMVMRELSKPRETYVLQRGDFLRPDKERGPLAPGVPSAVQRAFAQPVGSFANRLDLARWLVHADNPLTPRVTVNRIWMRYFGRGLVETEEDFGTQGSPPTHPELLDWLGRELMRLGWSQKKLHRLIVMSAVYRQSSQARSDLAVKDPLNLLLARQARLRVEGEIARDLALSASGLLTTTIGGPSVRPPQAEGVYAFTQNKRDWRAATGPDRYRRGLYTLFYRSAPYPLLTTFDAPDFQTTCTRRVRSNTPLQALTLANDPAFVELAQGLASRVWRETQPASSTTEPSAADLEQRRLERVFLLCQCRAPTAAEFGVLRDYYRQQLSAFSADAEAAEAIVPAKLVASDQPPSEAAALVCVARVLLNTDAFITRE